jgi:PmbA protein
MIKKSKQIASLQSVAESILSLAKDKGVDQTEISGGTEEGYSISVRMGITDIVQYQMNQGMTITVFSKHRKGTASTSDLSDTALAKTLQAAIDIAQFTEEDPCAGLAERELMAQTVLDLNLHHPWNLPVEKAIQMAVTCEKQAQNLDARITNSEGVSLETYQTESLYANSHGFVGVVPSTMHSMYCGLVASDNNKNDTMQRDGEYTVAREPKKLASIDWLAKQAVKRTVSRLHPKKIKTCKAPIILDAPIARSLWQHFIGAIHGARLYKKASFLLDRINTPVFSKTINIFERPHLKGSLGGTSFDADGVATYAKHFVEDGLLKNYLLNIYTARQLKLQTTANAGGVFNLFAEGDSLPFDALLKKMHRGLLVTELIGQGVDLVTGTYSRGAFGYWIENGIIQHPVTEITIAGNLKDMFLNVVNTGKDVDQRNNIQTGSVLLEEMTIAGIH